MDTIWSAYGLKSNPFFQDELTSDPTADHPVSLLVARSAELHLLTRQTVTGGEPHTRAVIEGEPGVGKTSFVNRFKADLNPRRFKTHEAPIKIDSSLTAREFVAETIRELLRIRTASLPTTRMVDAAANAAKKMVSKEARESATFWVALAQRVHGGRSPGGGFTAGVAGAQVGAQAQTGYVPAAEAKASLFPVFSEAIERFTAEVGAQVLFHVNNLENLGAHDWQGAAQLMLDAREYLKVRGTHWIFVGAPGVERHVFRANTQVSGFVPTAINLRRLSPEEVAELLGERYRHLKQGGRAYTPPVTPEDASLLYGQFFGDLRNFLRVLSEAATRVLGVDGVRPMRARDVTDAMAPEYTRKLQQDLGEHAFSRLAQIIAGNRGATEFRVSDVEAHTGIEQGPASRLVKQLLAHRVIAKGRREGRSQYYHVSGEVAVAFRLRPLDAHH